MNWSEIFTMGNYTWYVWSSWVLTFVVALVLFLHAKWQNTRYKKRIIRELQRAKIDKA